MLTNAEQLSAVFSTGYTAKFRYGDGIAEYPQQALLCLNFGPSSSIPVVLANVITVPAVDFPFNKPIHC
jgi:hypothetical protein